MTAGLFIDEFVIKSSVDDSTLTFCNRNPEDRDLLLYHFEVKISRSDLSATARVWAGHCLSHPAPWFHELAKNWQGWRGELVWNSLERELALVATRDRFGHITIRIELRSGLMERDWILRAFVVVDAGQLDELARTADRFFGHEGLLL
jgi:Family of unknown function (DUF6228)